MTWQPSEDMDREIRRWMKAKGWEVNCRPEYDFDREIYAWPRGPRRPLTDPQDLAGRS